MTIKQDIKDYLPLYLGCGMNYASHHEPQDEVYILTVDNLKEAMEFGDPPILRPLSDMTEEEFTEYFNKPKAVVTDKEIRWNGVIFNYKWQNENPRLNNDDGWAYSGVGITTNDKFTAEQTLWLLNKHFDIFGLIESGLAINATALKNKTKTT